MSHQPAEYLGIELWAKMLLSFKYYAVAEQERAAKEGAPLDALYRNQLGKWICVSDLKADHHFRPSYKAYLGMTSEERARKPFGDGR